MFQSLFINVYIYAYYLYGFFFRQFIKIWGPLTLTYVFDGETKRNITLGRYIGYYLPYVFSYPMGTYYIRSIKSDITNHVIYDGNIQEVGPIVCDINDEAEDIQINRRNVLFFDDTEPIQFDLKILDDYNRSVKKINWDRKKTPCSPVTMLDVIARIVGIPANRVQIMTKFPFKKQVSNINSVSIDMLYDP